MKKAAARRLRRASRTPPGGSEGSRRSYSPQSAAWAAQKCVSASRPRIRSCPFPTFHHQDRDAVSWGEASAVDSITDDMLETALECNAEWTSDGDGQWSVAEPTLSAAGAAGAALLEERREQQAQGVTRERELTFLVQLLHDPAYGLLLLHHHGKLLSLEDAGRHDDAHLHARRRLKRHLRARRAGRRHHHLLPPRRPRRRPRIRHPRRLVRYSSIIAARTVPWGIVLGSTHPRGRARAIRPHGVLQLLPDLGREGRDGALHRPVVDILLATPEHRDSRCGCRFGRHFGRIEEGRRVRGRAASLLLRRGRPRIRRHGLARGRVRPGLRRG